MRGTAKAIECDDLSSAWATAFLTALDAPGGELSRLVVTTRIPTSGVLRESPGIRAALASELSNKGEAAIETVSNTIFPLSMWNPGLPADALFERYNRIWPRLRRFRANNNGVYFRRLTAFGDENATVNQLKHIIETWREHGNHRHSAMQAAIFDPKRDHNNARQRGFPCLQQIAFDAQGTNGLDGLVVTGFYAKQNLFEKAYGNYLGLAHLGAFMAQELGLALREVTCIASVALYAEYPKCKLLKVAESLKGHLGWPTK